MLDWSNGRSSLLPSTRRIETFSMLVLRDFGKEAFSRPPMAVHIGSPVAWKIARFNPYPSIRRIRRRSTQLSLLAEVRFSRAPMVEHIGSRQAVVSAIASRIR
jgi:hypothetical protein